MFHMAVIMHKIAKGVNIKTLLQKTLEEIVFFNISVSYIDLIVIMNCFNQHPELF